MRGNEKWLGALGAALFVAGIWNATMEDDAPDRGPSAPPDAPTVEHQTISLDRLEFHHQGALERWKMRAGPGARVPVNAIVRAHQQRAAMVGSGGQDRSGGPWDDSSWTELGPSNVGGRTRALLINPDNPRVMYAGTASGGIFKSIDGASSWFPLDDFIAALSIGCMAMDPTDPRVLYAGTGEISGSGTSGAGILRSTNSGTTWTQLSATVGWLYVNTIAIAPDDPDLLLVGTDAGLFRSTNGGTSFSLVDADDTRDLHFHPSVSGVVLRGTIEGRVLRSTDGGQSWTQTLDGSNGNSDRRVQLEYAPSDPDVVYAAIGKEYDVHRSSDGGINFTEVYDGNGDRPFDFKTYKNALWVDPRDPDHVILGGTDLYRGTHAGGVLSFTRISNNNRDNSAHADQHLIVSHPQFGVGDNRTVYFTTDGGVYMTRDVDTLGGDADHTLGWQHVSNGLNAVQFYGAASDFYGQRVVGGTQDNGSLMYDGRQDTWSRVNGGDGVFNAIDPRDQDVMYFEGQNGVLRQSRDGGATSTKIATELDDDPPFLMHFHLDPNDPDRMWVGSRDLWRCEDLTVADPVFSSVFDGGGVKCRRIRVQAGDPDHVWAGYTDGNVFVSTNATSATPSFTLVGDGVLPDREPTGLAIDGSSGDVWVGFSGYESDNLWRTTDDGATWAAIGGLPALPINDILLHPTDPDCVIVATDLGIYATQDGGLSWDPNNQGPANVAVDQLWWACDQLFAATHGRGIWVARADHTIIVPDDQPTIADALVASGPECSVIEVRAGTYEENLRLGGREITLRAIDGPLRTIIDGGPGTNATMRCVDGEGPHAVIEGFTLVGGPREALVISNASPTVRDCRIVGGAPPNPRAGGARIQNGAAPSFRRCEFLANRSLHNAPASALSCIDSSAELVNCVFVDNHTTADRGAVYVSNGSLDVVQCSFAANVGAGGGRSIEAENATVRVHNSILWNEGANEIVADGNSAVEVFSSDVHGGWSGSGSANIDADPLYADVADHELRLLPGSPCLDAGDGSLLGKDVDSDLRGGRRLADSDRQGGEQVNMGAHESIPLDADDFASLQLAIDHADPVLGVVAISPGTYLENLRLLGKRILVHGTGGAERTILDGQNSSIVVRTFGAEREDTVLDGLTLRNGDGGGSGAGVRMTGGSWMTLRDCVIEGCRSGNRGGALAVENGGGVRMIRCRIRDCEGAVIAGGVAVVDGTALLEQCVITDCTGTISGGGFGVLAGLGRATNCTITRNTVGVQYWDAMELAGCIVWGNQDDERPSSGGTLSARYSNVGGAGLFPGVGNINADPVFVGSGADRESLRRRSPCVDAGDNRALGFEVGTDIAGGARFCDIPAVPDSGNTDGLRELVDMGAYEAGSGRWFNLGKGLEGHDGRHPRLKGEGPDAKGEGLSLELLRGRPFGPAYLMISPVREDRPFAGGTMVPGTVGRSVHFSLDAKGRADLSQLVDAPSILENPLVESSPLFLQVWVLDPSAPQGLAASNAVRFSIP